MIEDVPAVSTLDSSVHCVYIEICFPWYPAFILQGLKLVLLHHLYNHSSPIQSIILGNELKLWRDPFTTKSSFTFKLKSKYWLRTLQLLKIENILMEWASQTCLVGPFEHMKVKEITLPHTEIFTKKHNLSLSLSLWVFSHILKTLKEKIEFCTHWPLISCF